MQADTIVPNPANPQDLNRYAYVRNNPLRYIDPSGHDAWDPGVGGGCSINDLACLAQAGVGAYKEAYGIYGYPTDEELEAACAAGYNPFLDPDYAGASVPAYEPYFDFYYRWAYDTGGWLPLPDELRSDVFAYWTFAQTGEVPGATGWKHVGAMIAADPDSWGMTATAVFGMLKGGNAGDAVGTYSTYVVREDGEVIYVGRTRRSLLERQLEHRRTPGREDWVLDVDRSGLTKDQAQGREQILHDLYVDRGQLQNKNRPLGPRNPRYQQILGAGRGIR